MPNARGGITANIASIIEAMYSLIKLSILLIIIILIWINVDTVGPYAAIWANTITHLTANWKGSSISVERQISAENAIIQIAKETANSIAQGSKQNSDNTPTPTFNTVVARGAIIRASRNAPAIDGAHVLWVDGHPENNQLEEGILKDMGIEVRRASTTKEALSLLPGFAPDIIISNIAREGDEQFPLQNCPAHYFEVPPGVPVNLDTLNAEVMAGTGKSTGYGMAEAISRQFPFYADHAQPRIIYYSGINGGVSVSQCARISTNRRDILLQSVVSALEELRWTKLPQTLPPQ
jgi:hypothetical protein